MCSRWYVQHPVAGYAALSAWFTDGVVRLLDSLAMESLYNKHKQRQADQGNNSESKDKEKQKTQKITHTYLCRREKSNYDA